MSKKEIFGAAPWFGDTIPSILEDIKEVLTTGELVKGRHLAKFETAIAEMADTRYGLAVNSGGTALELALLALNVNGKEVIVPSQTFIASANAVTRAGGFPIFADIDKDTLCLDPEDVIRKIGPRTAGVMFVHMFGLVPPSILILKKICEEKKLFLIEDAAHAHGAHIGGKKAGSIGDVGCFSFFATKVVTTGEGGAITTDRKDIFDKVNSLRDHGRADNSPLFEVPGNNFRLSEIQCVLGWHQTSKLQEILEHRNKIAEIYRQIWSQHPLIYTLPSYSDSGHAYWRFAAYLDESINRDEFQKRMWINHKIRITWMYEPLCHQQPVSSLSGAQESLPSAEWSIKHLVNFPTHMGVSVEDAVYIGKCAVSEVEQYKAQPQ